MLNFYKLHLGENARDKFAEQALKNQYWESFYVLPSTVVMQEVRQKNNIRVGNFDTLVKEIIELFSTAIKPPISSFAREVLIKRCAVELFETGKIEYFAKVHQNNFFVKNLASLFAELMSMQISAQDFLLIVDNLQEEQLGAKQSKKYQELACIYLAYYDKLFELGERDIYLYYILAERLLLSLDEQAIAQDFLPWKNIYVSDFYNFNKLELAIIRRLSKLTQVHIAVTYETAREEVFSSLKTLIDNLVAIPHAQEGILNFEPIPQKADLRYLTQAFYNFNQEIDNALVAPHVELNAFLSKKQEMKFVVEAIKQKILAGAKATDFIIVVRDLADYPGLLEVFQDAQISSSLPEVCPVKNHFFMTLIMDILKLAANKFEKQTLAKVMFSPLMAATLEYDKGSLEKIFYEQDFNGFAEIIEKIAVDSDKLALSKALEKVATVVANVPKKASISTYQNFIETTIANFGFLKILGAQFKAQQISLEYFKGSLLSFTFLQRVFEELKNAYSLLTLDKEKISLTTFLEYLRQLATKHDLILQEGEPRGVRIIQAANAQGINAANVYILGLNDNMFPKKRVENWLLNARERSLLAIEDLKALERQVYEDTFFFASSLAMATNSLHISYLESERQGVSKYIFELKRVLPNLQVQKRDVFLPNNCERIFSQRTLQEYLVWQRSSSAEIALAEQWLVQKVGSDFLSAISKKTKAENISTAKITKLDFSVAQLETYRSCPFKYLARYVWQEQAWEQAKLESPRILEGIFVHEVLETFVHRYLGQKYPDKAQCLQELQELFWQIQKRYQTEQRVGNIFAWELKAQLLWRKLKLWFEEDYRLQEATNPLLPAYTELHFAPKGFLSEFELETSVGKIRLNGVIDRLDLQSEQVRIVDYKLGEAPEEKDIELGNSLQLPIYLCALKTLLPQEMANKQLTASYYSFKSDKYKYNIVYSEELLAKTSDNVEAIVSQIHQGSFLAQPLKIRNCSYCDYVHICRYSTIIEEEE